MIFNSVTKLSFQMQIYYSLYIVNYLISYVFYFLIMMGKARSWLQLFSAQSKDSSFSLPVHFLAFIGCVAVIVFIVKLLRLFLKHFLLQSLEWKEYGAGKNGWALVTGGTDGIGKEFARQYGRIGFNIFIVSRNPTKLSQVAQELKAECGPSIQIKTFALDFGKAESRDYARLEAVLHDVDVQILINNVGVSHDHPMYFYEESDEAMENIVKVNNLATMKITKLIIPQMVSRGKGLILNVGSFAGAFPTPFLQIYSGSKAFLASWSVSLAAEVAKQGVHVELLNTYYVATNMSKIKRTSWLRPSPQAYVTNAIKTVGRDFYNTPYFSQDLYYLFMKLVPSSYMLSMMTGVMEAGRAKALKRKDQ